MEREMMEIVEALEASNMGGVATPLVDSEGFPRADVDVHATRTLRNRMAVLNTDHKALMVRIEQGLVALHSSSPPAPQATGSAPPVSVAHIQAPPPLPTPPLPPLPMAAATGATPPALSTSTAPAPMDVVDAGDQLLQPFAEIDGVADGGPAASAGVAVGDKLLKFGGVHASNHDGLRALARLTQRSEGQIVPLLVERGETKLTLQLQPRRWPGSGLLGCHLRPM